MINFLLQTIDNQVRHDFVLEMINAVEYYNWKSPNSMAIYYSELKDLEKLKDDEFIKTCIPVGTIEFIYKFIDIFIKPNGSKEIKPINVPNELMEYEYSKRVIENASLNDINRHEWHRWLKEDGLFDVVFIKSNDIIKSSINDFYIIEDILDKKIIPNGNYQISECINIDSEYRCFIYNDELKGIQYYSGLFTKFPNVDKINEMMDIYRYQYNFNHPSTAPQAYTLDVAVTNDNKTVVMEVHDFYSCGLYGFNDLQALPYMFKRTFDNIKNKLLNGIDTNGGNTK